MQTDYFLTQMGRQWGWIVFRGVVAIAVALAAFVLPAQTLEVLTLSWGIYAFADGLIALVTAYQVREQNRPWATLAVVGLLGVAAGLTTFAWPAVTALTLLTLIALWALLMGLFQILTALRLRKSMRGEWMWVLSGIVSVLFGVGMLVAPGAGALALIWLVATYVLVFGILVTLFGFRLRAVAKQPWEPPQPTRPAPLGEPRLDR